MKRFRCDGQWMHCIEWCNNLRRCSDGADENATVCFVWALEVHRMFVQNFCKDRIPTPPPSPLMPGQRCKYYRHLKFFFLAILFHPETNLFSHPISFSSRHLAIVTRWTKRMDHCTTHHGICLSVASHHDCGIDLSKTTIPSSVARPVMTKRVHKFLWSFSHKVYL